jgi:uncharacterized protein (DUF488 family)
VRLYTIGFTKKSAETFFELLRAAGVRRVVDIRLNNVSQLAGFAKKADLAYILDQIAGIGYVHVPLLAPTQELLDAYRKQGIGSEAFERDFLALMRERAVEAAPEAALRDGDCLLCSEELPEHCHRRFVADYLRPYYAGLSVEHLT